MVTGSQENYNSQWMDEWKLRGLVKELGGKPERIYSRPQKTGILSPQASIGEYP
jgi:hypothetical protein